MDDICQPCLQTPFDPLMVMNTMGFTEDEFTKTVQAQTLCGEDETRLPRTRDAIVTCMDYRLQPSTWFSTIDQLPPYVVRNAGGRVTEDVIRSLVLGSRLLNFGAIFVVHHTGCGVELFDDGTVREWLGQDLGPATAGCRSCDETNRDIFGRSDYMAFLRFKNLADSVTQDVAILRQSPLISSRIPIYGFYFVIDTGELVEVPAAMRIGRPSTENWINALFLQPSPAALKKNKKNKDKDEKDCNGANDPPKPSPNPGPVRWMQGKNAVFTACPDVIKESRDRMPAKSSSCSSCAS